MEKSKKAHTTVTPIKTSGIRHPSQKELKRAIKRIAKDYGETLKKLAKV